MMKQSWENMGEGRRIQVIAQRSKNKENKRGQVIMRLLSRAVKKQRVDGGSDLRTFKSYFSDMEGVRRPK